MPTGDYEDTVYVMDYLNTLGPKTVLDVGAGFGRWGFLCRCHLSMGHSLTVNSEQALAIDAVEVFDDNISPIYACVYNKTHKGDAREVVPGLDDYDVVICGDMIEHISKEDGWNLICEMRSKSRMAFVLALPLGECPQEEIYGNEYEVHQSTWLASDFAGEDCHVKTFDYHLKGVRIGVVIFPRSDHSRWLLKVTNDPVRRWLSMMKGRFANAG